MQSLWLDAPDGLQITNEDIARLAQMIGTEVLDTKRRVADLHQGLNAIPELERGDWARTVYARAELDIFGGLHFADDLPSDGR